uniref:Ribonuclease HII n=1 Tax=Anthurium amnicola TaxID=1678845 RepID=A0A1D1YG25_9ARAE
MPRPEKGERDTQPGMEGREIFMEMPSFRYWPEFRLGRTGSLSGSPRKRPPADRADLPGEVVDGRNTRVEDSDDSCEDFEFAFVSMIPVDGSEQNAANEVFSDGRIRPVALFLQEPDLLPHQDGDAEGGNHGAAGVSEGAVHLNFQKMVVDDGGPPSTPSPSAPSESGELEVVPEESHCAWTPGSTPPSPDLCKKSRSSGDSSKRWRLRDLVAGRSHSNGKGKFVFIAALRSAAQKKAKKSPGDWSRTTPAPVPGPKKAEAPTAAAGDRKKGKGAGSAGEMDVPTAHRLYYMKTVAAAGDRRRSFLPYRKDLLGLFANVNSAGRSFHT